MQIRKAERKAVKIKLAITGPSGSGKTMGALLLAKGLVGTGRILVIDTEDGSSNLYADHNLTKGIDFDVLELEAPYTISKYLEALRVAQEEKYDVIIIDSISHGWAGEGGLLDKKNSLDARGGNSFTNWASITKEQELFKAKLVHCDTHLICTMRSKQEHVIEMNEKGRSAPKKVGMAPIQRDGMEYEFTTVFDCAMDHTYHASKDRTGLFDGVIELLSIKTGEAIKQWLEGGKPYEKKESEVEKKYSSLLVHYKSDDKLSAAEIITALSADDKKGIAALCDKEMLDWIKVVSIGSNRG